MTLADTTSQSDLHYRGLRDWYRLNAGNLTHQETWTRKVTDPMYRGAYGAKLKLTMRMPQLNRLKAAFEQSSLRGK